MCNKLILCTLSFAVSLFAADPLVGTWKLNIQKSQIHNPVRSETMKVEETAPHTYHFVMNIVNAQGRKEHGDLTRIADGKEHRPEGVNGEGKPVASPRYTEIISPDLTKMVFKRDGKVLGESDIQYSADGKTQTTTQTGIDANGKPYKDVRVWEKQ